MTARLLAALMALPLGLGAPTGRQAPSVRIAVNFPRERSATPLDGRLLFLVSTDSTAEPRRQIADGPETQLVFGTDVNGWAPGADVWVDGSAFGYPVRSLAALPP